ncbi:MAG: glycosyltransferase family 39 protein [Candidatus Aenigmatarchaeota archaeon]
MPNNRISKRREKIENKEIACLIFILFLASFLTFYPHLNYPYPLHVDEWFHISVAKMIASNQKIDWYSGKPFELGLERGWHLTLAFIQKFFNLSVKQWVFLPILFHFLSILSVFYFTSKIFGKKEALISALLIALVPSNVTIGGPVFLVPINLSLIFIPLALLFAFELTNLKPIYNHLALFAITTFILYTHPPTAMVLLTILGFYLLLNLKNKQKAKEILSVLIASILFSLPNYIPEIQTKGIKAVQFNFWFYLREIPSLYGFLPTGSFILGFYFLAKTKSKEIWALLLTSLTLTLNIFLFVRLNLNWLIPYQRTYIPLFLLMSIIASFGYTKLLKMEKPFKNFGSALLLISLVATSFLAIERNLKTPYYYLIDDEDYENFLWIKENTREDTIVLLDPWKARAFATIAERRVYSVMPFGPDEKYLELVDNAYKFFKQNCTNTSFLVENNISLVYSPVKCQNENLVNLKGNIYFFKSAYP